MADNMIPVDNRNPFAPWGFHEDYKYTAEASEDNSTIVLETPKFNSKLTNAKMKNVVAENAEFKVKTLDGESYGMPENFGTNNDTTVYPNVATNAYGMDKDLQPVREQGENLEYYGIQGADLEKYNDAENVQESEDEETDDTENGDGETPSGENPSGENPSGENPSGENPSGENPSGENPSGENPSGENPSGENPSGDNENTEVPQNSGENNGNSEVTNS